MNNLIDERDERTRKRKKRKRKMDSIIGLSYHEEDRNVMALSSAITLSDKTARLLDEGFCDNGFVLKKGTLEKFLNGKNENVRGWEQTENGWERTDVLNLTDDFKGAVNLGHMDFATFPFIIGEWNKSDLALVDIENDRKAIDVAVRLDEDSTFVKELARQPYDIGISAEFYYHINESDTEELSELMGEYLPVIDEIFIFAYGLVGECGNVNSSGLELKGETMSKEKILNAEDQVKALADDTDVAEDVTEDVTEDITEEPTDEVTEEPAGLAAEDGEPEGDPETDAPEEPVDDDVSEEPSADEDEGDDDGDDDDLKDEGGVDEDDIDEDEADEAALSFDDLLAKIATLTAEVERLKDIEGKYAALKKSHRRLNRKLEEEKQAKADFFEKTKHLSTELFENEGAAEKEEAEAAMKLAKEREYYKGDGIAD